MKPQISLCAAAARPKFWKRLYDSLSQNSVSFEIVFVGPNPPDFTLPDNFAFILSKVKPAQAYEIAFRNARGELGGWMADDCLYNEPIANCPNALDSVWQNYQDSIKQYADKKTIFSQITIEDYKDTGHADWIHHRFFYARMNTPQMAPLGFINLEFFRELGGYDKNFVAGQSENDVVMRAIAAGGRVQTAKDSKVLLNHGEAHGAYPFRKAYHDDRRFLENCWVKEGYGTYESNRPFTLSPVRLRPFQPFEDKDLLTKNQGPEGNWAI